MLVLAGILGLLLQLRQTGGFRWYGAFLLLAGLILLVLSLSIPARESGVAAVRTRLDQAVPRYQFNEFHQIRVKATPEQVYVALKAVTAEEIRFFRTLTWIRRCGADGEESILNAPAGEPLLAVATRSGFKVLAEEPGRELVIGMLVARKTFAAMNFRISPDGPGSLITTETRVFGSTDQARRRFTLYWRAIYPGSALIRRSWLQAIRKRAERA